jgi:hypothetical protein
MPVNHVETGDLPSNWCRVEEGLLKALLDNVFGILSNASEPQAWRRKSSAGAARSKPQPPRHFRADPSRRVVSRRVRVFGLISYRTKNCQSPVSFLRACLMRRVAYRNKATDERECGIGHLFSSRCRLSARARGYRNRIDFVQHGRLLDSEVSSIESGYFASDP